MKSAGRTNSLLYSRKVPYTCHQRLMQPFPFRGGNLTYKHEPSYVYKVGQMYFANLDNSEDDPRYPPYMNVQRPYKCPYLMAPVDVGVTTCPHRTLRRYLHWRHQPKFFTRYPTFVHFLRACQTYGDSDRVRQGRFDGILPTFEFQADHMAIAQAVRRAEGRRP